MSTYQDPRIECTEDGVRIRWYYPWGARYVPYANITSLERFALSASRGKLRIWGTGTFQYWANFDPGRPKKEAGFTLATTKGMNALITPDDPDTFERVVNEHLATGSA